MNGIAVIEDDPNLRNLIRLILSEIGMPITLFDHGWQGLDAVINGGFQVLVLDLMLPGVNGLEICRRIRARDQKLPILMLTAKSELEDKILGLEMGADDYLTKPFSNEELLARVRALLRRSKVNVHELKQDNILIFGELTIDQLNCTVTKNNEIINLTTKEYELLKLLANNPNRNFSRLEILERVWGDNFEGLEHTVNSNINRLRQKIEKDSAKPVYLTTVWGLGYRFTKPDSW